jgi:hypothetical protein
VSGKGKGKVKSSGAGVGDCASLAGPSSTPNTTQVTWKVGKGKPKLNKSKVTFTLTTPLPTDPSGFTVTGSVTSGSFNTNAASATVHLAQTNAAISSACSSPTGLSSLTIASGTASN